MTEEILFFGDIHNDYRCLSLDYSCAIDFDNYDFRSVLHLYLYLKFKNNDKIRKNLLELTEKKEISDYAKKIIEEEEEIEDYDLGNDMFNMSLAVKARVYQSEAIKSILLESKKKDLLYIVQHFVINSSLWTYKNMENDMVADPIETEESNNGQNLYGKVLKMIRHMVRQSYNLNK